MGGRFGLYIDILLKLMAKGSGPPGDCEVLNNEYRNLVIFGRGRELITALRRFLASPGIDSSNLAFAGDEVAWLKGYYVEDEYDITVLLHTNEVISAYVTKGM